MHSVIATGATALSGAFSNATDSAVSTFLAKAPSLFSKKRECKVLDEASLFNTIHGLSKLSSSQSSNPAASVLTRCVGSFLGRLGEVEDSRLMTFPGNPHGPPPDDDCTKSQLVGDCLVTVANGLFKNLPTTSVPGSLAWFGALERMTPSKKIAEKMWDCVVPK